jgi:hypothetical protein
MSLMFMFAEEDGWSQLSMASWFWCHELTSLVKRCWS